MQCPWQASKQVVPMAGARDLVLCVSVSQGLRPLQAMQPGSPGSVMEGLHCHLWRLLDFRVNKKHRAVGTRELANG